VRVVPLLPNFVGVGEAGKRCLEWAREYQKQKNNENVSQLSPFHFEQLKKKKLSLNFKIEKKFKDGLVL